MWRTCKAAGRPWPRISDDDVIDYMIMEAVAIKIGKQEEQAQKEADAKQKQAEAREQLKEMVR